MSVSRAGTRRFVAVVFVAVSGALVSAAEIPMNERRSGTTFMGRELRAMQDDDTSNPGMLSVLDGEALWTQKAGAADRACAECHEAAAMGGVAARFPAYDEARKRPVDLSHRINICREEKQGAPRLAAESKELLALSAYVGKQSRGMPIAPPDDARLTPFRERGRALFNRRQGQLNLACTHCHDDNWGKPLAGNPIPQAHPTGYPIYRLEWQALGSLQRRFRNCMIGVRAEPYAYGSDEFVDLELFLMSRANGMTIETPAVRP